MPKEQSQNLWLKARNPLLHLLLIYLLGCLHDPADLNWAGSWCRGQLGLASRGWSGLEQFSSAAHAAPGTLGTDRLAQKADPTAQALSKPLVPSCPLNSH